MTNEIIIRVAQAADESQWRSLWAAYLKFYAWNLTDEVTSGTWQRVLSETSAIHARVATYNGIVVGFSIYVLHEGSWTLAPHCYLEDLFVDSAYRGKGIGRALIDDLLALAKLQKWERLYWHTQTSNINARVLYDQYAPADDVVRYKITIAQDNAS